MEEPYVKYSIANRKLIEKVVALDVYMLQSRESLREQLDHEFTLEVSHQIKLGFDKVGPSTLQAPIAASLSRLLFVWFVALECINLTVPVLIIPISAINIYLMFNLT